MLALVERARLAGIPRISLSVEVDNAAIDLYRSLGFTEVEVAHGAATMTLALTS